MHGRHSAPRRGGIRIRITRIADKITLFRILGVAAPVGMVGAMAPGTALAATAVPDHASSDTHPQAAAQHKVVTVAKRVIHRIHHKQRVVTVVSGDTLYGIAARDCGNGALWPRLFRASRNSLGPDPDLIYPGQHVTLACHAAPVVKEAAADDPPAPTRLKVRHHHKPKVSVAAEAAPAPKVVKHHHVRHHKHHHGRAVAGGMVESPGGHLTPEHVLRPLFRFARHQLGKQYIFGGIGPAGFDCSGLVMEAYRAAGVYLPRTSQAQFLYGTHVKRARKGDLVFFGSTAGPHHVGLVIGHGRMIEASHTGVPVRISRYTTRPDIAGFTRPWLVHHNGVARHKVHPAHVSVKINGVIGTSAHGFLPANYGTIYRFLRAHGLTGDVAAGVLGNIWQESQGNPESGTPSAGGLIGWTGNWSNYSSSPMQTGNLQVDLKVQLRALMRYISSNGSKADINSHASSAAAAAEHFEAQYERAGIPAMSNRVAAAEAVAHAEGLAR